MTAAISHSVTHDNVERRTAPIAVGAQGRTIGGYAAVFNSPSRMIPRMMGSSFTERLLPTFFNEARTAGWPGIQGSGVLCRYNHSDQYLLGTTRAGTCQLNLDRTGLEYRTEVPKCRDDVLELVARGDVAQSSFTFRDAQDEWGYMGGVTVRTLITGGVVDVAPVSSVAAYADTTCALRSLAAYKDVAEEDVRALAERDELRRLFTRSDRPQQRSTQPRGETMLNDSSQWEIQRHHMMQLDRLHRRRMEWQRREIAEIEGARRLLRRPTLRVGR
jgi:HK97 family phage prohead protease